MDEKGELGPELANFEFEFNKTARNKYENPYLETAKRMTGIFRLMSVWKGSVIKLIYHNIFLFLLPYTALSLLYRLVLIEHEYYRELFEVVCIFAQKFSSLIPLSFLTGFYVTQVVTRWWNMFTVLPYPDRIALKLISYISGKDHFKKNLRRTVMRYVNLSTILVYRLVSRNVLKRFPDMASLVKAKLLLSHEAERLAKVDKLTPHETTWTPLLWASKLIQRAREQGKVVLEAPVYANLVASFDYIEHANRSILNYGWISFPLAYTQVASISVYLYFGAALFGRQFLIPRGDHRNNSTFPELTHVAYASSGPYSFHTPDLYFPVFTIIEFISYMGWIKVAETLLNPFGDDDEDFEINYLIDRNLQVSYLMVDQADMDLEMAEDPFLEAGIAIPEELPYKEPPRATKHHLGKKLSHAFLGTKLKDDGSSIASPSIKRFQKNDISRQSSQLSHLSQYSQEPSVQYSPSIKDLRANLKRIEDNESEEEAGQTEDKRSPDKVVERKIGIVNGGVDNICFIDVDDEKRQLAEWCKL